jgi:hypothetical protein
VSQSQRWDGTSFCLLEGWVILHWSIYVQSCCKCTIKGSPFCLCCSMLTLVSILSLLKHFTDILIGLYIFKIKVGPRVLGLWTCNSYSRTVPMVSWGQTAVTFVMLSKVPHCALPLLEVLGLCILGQSVPDFFPSRSFLWYVFTADWQWPQPAFVERLHEARDRVSYHSPIKPDLYSTPTGRHGDCPLLQMRTRRFRKNTQLAQIHQGNRQGQTAHWVLGGPLDFPGAPCVHMDLPRQSGD